MPRKIIIILQWKWELLKMLVFRIKKTKKRPEKIVKFLWPFFQTDPILRFSHLHPPLHQDRKSKHHQSNIPSYFRKPRKVGFGW